MSRLQSSRGKRFQNSSSLARRLRRRPIVKSLRYGPGLEVLENRTLLAFTANVSGTSVKFTSSNTTDALYLQTDAFSGDLQWRDSSSGTWNDLGFIPGSGGNTTVTLEIYNPVFIETIFGAGGDLTFEGYSTPGNDGTVGFIGPSQVSVDGGIHTEGGGLTLQYLQGLTVNSDAVLSTRQLADYALLTPGQEQNNPSTGNSGAITLGVGNLDPLNQILNIKFQTPQINIDSGALILANTTTTQGGVLVPDSHGHQAGEIHVSATNFSWTVGGVGLLADSLSLLAREADVYVGSSAAIRGDDVGLTAQGGDINVVQYLTGAALGVSYSQVPTTASADIADFAAGAVGALISASLQAKFPALKSILSPGFASFTFKQGTARVEVEQNAQIDADGSVTVSATANALAQGQAAYSGSGISSSLQNSRGIMASVAGSYAESDTYALIDAGATINAGGSVTIETSGITNSNTIADVFQNVADGNPPTNTKQFAIAVSVAQQTSKATVSQGATVTAGGIITVSAGGTGGNQNTNKSEAVTTSYRDGSAGVAVDVDVNINDVEATVDGSLTADLSQMKAAGPTQVTFNPLRQADLADSIIDFGQTDGYQTGDQVTYASGTGGPIGGLTSGQTYYVMVVDPERIRLASTLANAQAGNYIVFEPFPTLAAATSASLPSGTALTFAPGPSLSAASASTSLTFNPGPSMTGSPTLVFTPGQNSTPATIDRSTGSWLSDGFAPGDIITVSGTLENNGNYTIGSISTDGGAGSRAGPHQRQPGRRDQQRSDSGRARYFGAFQRKLDHRRLRTGQTIQIAGTGKNNASYTIQALSSDGTTLYLPASSLQSETTSAGTITATAGPGLSGTITLGSGTWSGDGYAAGNSITVAGTASNDGTYTIKSINGETLFIAPAITNNGGLKTEANTTSSTVTVTASSLTAVTELNQLGNGLSLGFDPGYTNAQAVVYHAVPGEAIGGLTDGQTYYVIRNLTFNSVTVDTSGSTLTLPADPGFAAGDSVVFVSSTDQNNLGLIPGHTYQVVLDDSQPDVLQFTDPSAANPSAIVSLSLAGSGPVSITLKPVNEIELSATESAGTPGRRWSCMRLHNLPARSRR